MDFGTQGINPVLAGTKPHHLIDRIDAVGLKDWGVGITSFPPFNKNLHIDKGGL